MLRERVLEQPRDVLALHLDVPAAGVLWELRVEEDTARGRDPALGTGADADPLVERDRAGSQRGERLLGVGHRLSDLERLLDRAAGLQQLRVGRLPVEQLRGRVQVRGGGAPAVSG